MTERKWKLTPENVRKVMEYVWTQVKDVTDPLEIIVRPAKSKRSIDQNARYWRMLREVSAVVWVGGRQYSPEVWHEHFAREFIGCEDLPSGDRKAISTTTLNVDEFGEYMTQIEAWCAQEGYQVMEGA